MEPREPEEQERPSPRVWRDLAALLLGVCLLEVLLDLVAGLRVHPAPPLPGGGWLPEEPWHQAPLAAYLYNLRDALGLAGPTFAFAIHLVVGAGTALAAWDLARRVAGRWAGLASGIALGAGSVVLMRDLEATGAPWLLLLWTALLALLLRFAPRLTLGAAFCLGVWLAAVALLYHHALWLLPFVAAWVGLAQWAHEQERWKIRTLAFLLGALLAPMIYLGAAAWVGEPTAALPAVVHEDLRAGVVPGQFESGSDAPPAVWHVMAQPREWARGLLWKAACIPYPVVRSTVTWELYLLWAWFLPAILLGLWGLLMSLVRTEWRRLLPQLTVLVPALAWFVFFPLPGLQLLQAPALAALACYGVGRCVGLWKQRLWARLAGAVVLLAVLGLLWSLALHAQLRWFRS